MHIFGRNPVLEALSGSGNASVEKVFVQYGSEGTVIDSIWHSAKKRNIPCSTMDKGKFGALEREVCGAQAHGRAQGVIAFVTALKLLSVAQLIEQCFERDEHPVIVALDGINDPHNLGAIARSAECAGAHGFLVPETKSAPLSGAAMKTSAGALEHLAVARTGNFTKALQDLKNAGFTVLGLDANGTQSYTNQLYDEATVLVVGSEGDGMSASVAKMCDERIAIPLRGAIESLNASVAAGVILFEAARQRASHRR